MANAQSKNIAENIISSTTSIVTNISNNDSVKIGQGQIINVVGGGDVDISNIYMEQGGYVNLSSVSQMANSIDVQNEIVNQISQMAKSVAEKINIGNFSEAENSIQSLVQSTITCVNQFSKTCLVDSSQSQEINVNARGNVKINGVVMKQLIDGAANCMGNIVNENKIKTILDNIVDQTASAKSSGIDPTVIFIAIAIIVVGTTGTAAYAFKSTLQYVMPIIGIILIVIGIFFMKKFQAKHAVWYGFTNGINDSSPKCAGKLSTIKTEEKIPREDVEKKVLSIKECSAADWTKEKTIFYKGDVSDDCVKDLTKFSDTFGGISPFVKRLQTVFFAGTGKPNFNQGEFGQMFISTDTGKILRKDKISGAWNEIVDLGMKDFSVACLSDEVHPYEESVCHYPGKDTSMIEYTIGTNLDKNKQIGLLIKDAYNFTKVEKDSGGQFVPSADSSIAGPGKILDAKTPDEMNENSTWTCIVTKNKSTDLFIGVGIIIGGIIMMSTGGALFLTSKKSGPVQPPISSKFSFEDYLESHY
jgi:hypothetical protein